MKPTFLRVGVPKSKTRAPLTVKPPTESGNPASGLSNLRCYTGTGTSHEWLIPSGRVAGDGIFAFIATETPGTITPPSGYTLLDSLWSGDYVVYWKVSDGTETDTTFSTSLGDEVAATFARIPANGSTLSTPDIASAVPNIPSSTTVDPVAVTPAAGAGTYHIISVLMMNRGEPIPDDDGAVSSGYTFLNSCDVGGGILAPEVWIQQKLSTAVVTTEDPGVVAWDTSGTSRKFGSFTIAVAVTSADPAVVGYPVTASDIDSEASTDGQVLTSDGAGNAAWEDASGVTDHGALTGLADDDHSQYVLVDGTRALSGDLSMGSNKLTNVTDPTSAQDAATKAYVDSAAAYYELLVASTDSTIDRFVATADKTIANTTTETTMFGTGEGNLTFPSGFFTAGKSIRLLMRGRLSDTGTPDLTIKVKLGSTVVASVGPTALTGISDVEWMIDGLITCRSTGASGTFVGGGLFDYDDGTELSLGSGSDISIDTTASQTLDVTWTWGAASASNTITVREAAVTLIDPNRDGVGGLEPVFTEAGDDYVYGLVP